MPRMQRECCAGEVEDWEPGGEASTPGFTPKRGCANEDGSAPLCLSVLPGFQKEPITCPILRSALRFTKPLPSWGWSWDPDNCPGGHSPAPTDLTLAFQTFDEQTGQEAESRTVESVRSVLRGPV